MGRIVGIARDRAIRAAIVAGVAISVVLGLAAPGWATESIIFGSTVCTTGDQVVIWTIENGADGVPMSIAFVTASIGSQQYAATGWTPVLAGRAWTSATTIVPAGVSGTLTLRVYATWSNGLNRIVGKSIALPEDCLPPMTTTTRLEQPNTTSTTTRPEPPTTQPEPPTTQPETPTTQGETPTTEPPTTTIDVGGTTTVTGPPTNPPPTTTLGDAGGPTPGGPTPTTKPGKATLPRTGAGATFLFVFGGIFVAIGGSILMHKRNSWAALRGHETAADVRRATEKKKRALFVYLPPRR